MVVVIGSTEAAGIITLELPVTMEALGGEILTRDTPGELVLIMWSPTSIWLLTMGVSE